MRTYEEIYLSMQAKNDGERFTILELITIFENESSWVGTSQQLLNIKSYSHEITGIRPGECSACNLEAIKNLAKWKKQHEPTILAELNKKELKKGKK